MSVAETETPSQAGRLLRYLPLLLIAAAVVAVFATGANEYLSLSALEENYERLQAFVEANFFLALLAFAGVYAGVTALSLPGGGVLSLTAGFLFGTLVGVPLVVVSATVGGSIIFLAAKTSLGETLRRYGGRHVEKMEDGFNRNAFSYLLLLRLVPLFPFFIVNLVPAFLGVRFPTYFFATLIGIIPGTFAYVSAGNGIGAVLRAGGDVKLSGLLTQPAVLVPIVALSVLALLPIAYKTFVRNTDADLPTGE